MPVPKGTRFFVVTNKDGSKTRIATFKGKTIEAKRLKRARKKK